ncbi:hypothetical protein SUDANB121_01863 [Nocardiopsis dassonvillei]|uniref:protein kinase domain-containing protein n=1 Tax=Nocardiopsis dassonvillei TaxID=2014 RepID=UPI003F54DABA
MTSHPSQSLCARTEPLTSDDPPEVGGYRIEGRVADTGGGVLYAARRNGGEPVVLALAAAEAAPEALPEPRDAGVCAVGAVDTGELDGRPWAVLPDQPGPDLRRHVAARGALPEWGAVMLAAAVAEALSVLHGEGTAHGEVGPDVLVLTDAGPRLLDTGLGRRAEAPAVPGLRGVPGWTAPEVYEDGLSTAAADVFGWACLVVLAATGREPFGESPAARLGRRAALVEMERRARQDAVDLEGVPEGLRGVVARALSPEPGERPPADEALAAALSHLDGRDGEPTAVRLRAVLPGSGGKAARRGGTGAAGAAGAAAEASDGADASDGSAALAAAGVVAGADARPGGAGGSAGADDTTVLEPGAVVDGGGAGTGASDAPSGTEEATVPVAAADSGGAGGSGGSEGADEVTVPVTGAAVDGGGAGGTGGPEGADETTVPVVGVASGGAGGSAGADDTTVLNAGAVVDRAAGTGGSGTAAGTGETTAPAVPVAAGGAGVLPGRSATPAGADDTTVPRVPDARGPATAAVPGVPAAGSAAPAPGGGSPGFGIYTDPMTLEGSAVAGAAPAAPPVAGTPPVPAPDTGFGVHTAPVDATPAPGWDARGEAAGTTATMVRDTSTGDRTALLVNAGTVVALLIGVLVVMLFRTGVL